ncbi:MAG TPA: hypothetical protein PLB91_14635 [Spirochaetales bacterium]|nr:hypothetical protein [Spirochaetales bacterium]HRY56006.1 hypothetical protein [Spirochaetia bacterium]HRZ65989.1 hypothetical protein [Spirochaetia bacterium]
MSARRLEKRAGSRARRALGRLSRLALALLCAAPRAFAEPELSGSIESGLSGSAGTGGAAAFSCGFEEFANLRLRTRVGEAGTVYAAINLVAASGEAARRAALLEAAAPGPLAASSFAAGSGYAAALELERLYFRLEGEGADLQAGLQRLAFGYGQAFSPSDFLSPPNPLHPEARPRGRLGLAASAYPADSAKLGAFAFAGTDPLEADGGGTLLGAQAELHGAAASIQALYAFEAPGPEAELGLHRAGLSLKLEAGAGIALDLLYSYDAEDPAGLAGLEASLGADYSFLDGDLYVLGQYLYNGPGPLDPEDEIGELYAEAGWYETAPLERLPAAEGLRELNRRNYLYASLAYRVDDYTSATLSCLAGLDDLSFSPALELEHEPFQGMVLSCRCRLPLDPRSFSSGGERGELGPDNSGSLASVELKAKLRF